MNKKIFKIIKAHQNIVIARHINGDPDAMASAFALKETINLTFPKKNVVLVGVTSSRFNYMGKLNRGNYNNLEDCLLIALDTPDKKRLDLDTFNNYSYSIKIDHHPKIETFCDLELINDTKSSASEMVFDLINETNLKMNKHIAELLFYGIVADTGRFLFSNTSGNVLKIISFLIDEYKVNLEKLYFNLYHKPFNEFKFQGYMANNMKITENGVGYIKIGTEVLDKYHLDSASCGDTINEFNNVDEFIVWMSAVEDKNNNNIRVSIRSRGPIVNKLAEKYNGGGHKVACGARLSSFEDVDLLINDLDKLCQKYQGSAKNEDN